MFRRRILSYFGKWYERLLLALILFAAAFFVYVFVDTVSSARDMPEGGMSVIDPSHADTESQLSYENQINFSGVYASITPNQKEWVSDEEELSEGIFCVTTEDIQYMLYSIDSSDIAGTSRTLADFDNIWIDSHNDAFYAVLNISGKDIDLSDYYILVRDDTGLYGSRTLLNFYEAETVDISDSIIMGTVLAPDAEVICDGATVYGQLQCESVTGNMAMYRDMRFTGYRKVTDNLDVLTVKNDPVRIAAIEYLINNDPDHIYADYSIASSIRTSDASAVRRLNINSQGAVLESLEEDLLLFPNIEELTISGGEITSLSLAQFPGIRSLSVTSTNISSLDISAATGLERLILDRNPELKTLDFSHNPHIKVLSYSETPLGWMDYSLLPELYYLDCSRSDVESYLTISGESLQNIRMLDISGNGEIQTFYIQTFPKLESVNCSSCSIIELDFSQSKSLTYFKGSYNRLRNIDFTGAVNLKYIEAYGSSVESLDIRGLKPQTVYCTVKMITDEGEVYPHGFGPPANT